LFHADGQCADIIQDDFRINCLLLSFPHTLTFTLNHGRNSVIPPVTLILDLVLAGQIMFGFCSYIRFRFFLSRSVSQAWRRVSGIFEMVYFVLHDACSGNGIVVYIGFIRLQILNTPLFL
jgi:hypothetical protein